MRFISVDKLEPGMIVARGITNSSDTFVLRAGVTLTDQYIRRLTESGYLGAYIKDELSEDVMIMETIRPEVFAAGVRAVRDENIGGMLTVSKAIVSEVLFSEYLSADLLDLRSYDDYTYHHSVNVALYASMVGRRMNLNTHDLELLCMAGICHDLGKCRIPVEIINKPGRLTDEEYEIVKTHSKLSFDILGENYGVSAKVKQAVLYHHENEDGSGYPAGIRGDKIPLFSKILHAVDVFDALTSKRPYKDPYTPSEALEYIQGGKGILFDEHVVDVMLGVIPAYPPGISVTLSNAEECLVISHTREALRPKVRVIESGETVNLSTDEKYQDITIVESSILPKQHYVEEIELLNEQRPPSFGTETDKTVLIINSSMNMLINAKASLENAYHLMLVTNAIEALNYVAKSGPPDLVIMDMDLPDHDGVIIMQKIREMTGLEDLPVIFCTMNATEEVRRKCSEMHAVEYMVKPVKPVYLRERVAEFFKNVT